MFVCTHILTVRTQVFLFKSNYGTAVAKTPPLQSNVLYANHSSGRGTRPPSFEDPIFDLNHSKDKNSGLSEVGFDDTS